MATERKKYPRGEWPEYRKEKQSEWRKANRSTLAADVPREVAVVFRAWCKSQGKTVSATLAEYVYSCIEDHPGDSQP